MGGNLGGTPKLVSILVFRIVAYSINASTSETFNPRMVSDTVKLVNLKERFDEVYNAVFVHQYKEKGKVILGRLCFCQANKTNLLNTDSLLSDYADYEN